MDWKKEILTKGEQKTFPLTKHNNTQKAPPKYRRGF